MLPPVHPLSPQMNSIPSPLHSHILFPRNLSQYFQTHQQYYPSGHQTKCDFCRGDINGDTCAYCCEKCGFHVHASCARPPRRIQHPRHEHPLDLRVPVDERSGWWFDYRCVEFDRGCEFQLGPDFAIRTLWAEKYYGSMLREAGDGESRPRYAHEHPLTSFPERTRVFCMGCDVQISEEAYGCSECNFFLHEACAKAALEIRSHPFHPEHPLFLFYDSSNRRSCHACRREHFVGYRCEECGLSFHLSCVISTMPCEDDDEREDVRRRSSATDHSLHPHQLSSYHSKTQTKIKCYICEDRIPSGDFFGCLDCKFFLHESCVQPRIDAIQRYLHPEHTLTFALFYIDGKRKCSICESPVYSYCYSCQMCDFIIHETCAAATLSDLEKVEGMTVQCSVHEHELKLYYTNESERCAVCDGFVQKNTLAYRCLSRECWSVLHKSCAQLPSNLVHPSHSAHPLTFCFRPSQEDIVCRGCSRQIRGVSAFACGECDFYLDGLCAQTPTLKHPFHEHHLFYFADVREDLEFECSACRKSCKLDLFRCAQCNFNLHYECSQLLPTITSQHHWDPLVLRESFIEDDLGEYYCDICERRRDPKKWVYFCESCNYNFVAHVECALSPAKLKVIEEDDFITREEGIELAQREVAAAEATLKPLMAKLESLRAKLEELKTEHTKWINMSVIEGDESIRGDEDTATADAGITYSGGIGELTSKMDSLS